MMMHQQMIAVRRVRHVVDVARHVLELSGNPRPRRVAQFNSPASAECQRIALRPIAYGLDWIPCSLERGPLFGRIGVHGPELDVEVLAAAGESCRVRAERQRVWPAEMAVHGHALLFRRWIPDPHGPVMAR